MNDPQMNDILARLNSVGTKPASASNGHSSSAGDPAMHDILSKFHAVSGKYQQVNESLGAEQKRVGQVGPTDMPSKKKDHPFKGQLVGEDYNVDEYDQEGEMAKGQLDRAADAAQELHDILDDSDNLPEWVQSKITKALDYLDTARDYVKSEFNEAVEGAENSLTMGIPLFIRMLEFAREEARTDADLHHVTKKMIDMGGNVTMDDYEEIMTSVGGEESKMGEAAGDKLTDLEYGSATATATPTVGGYHQRRDLSTGSYTDYTDRGPISTQTTYDKSGQMTSQHAQARVGDQSMARSRFYPKKRVGEAGETMSDRMQKLSSWRNPEAEANFAKTHAKYGVDGADQSRRMHSSFFQNPNEFASPRQMAQTAMNMGMSPEQVDSALPKDFKFDPNDQGFNRDRSSGFKTHFDEDYVGSKEAPQDLVSSLNKSYKDFLKELEATNAAKPDRELRSKTEKPKKFGNILDEE